LVSLGEWKVQYFSYSGTTVIRSGDEKVDGIGIFNMATNRCPISNEGVGKSIGETWRITEVEARNQ
jgi:hypothetical protein